FASEAAAHAVSGEPRHPGRELDGAASADRASRVGSVARWLGDRAGEAAEPRDEVQRGDAGRPRPARVTLTRWSRRVRTQQACGSNSVVECHLAKVDVEGSNPFSRSNFKTTKTGLREQNAPEPSTFLVDPRGSESTSGSTEARHQASPSGRLRP